MNLFPMIQPQSEPILEEMPLYKEIAWDYKEDIPIFKNGSPVTVSGSDAIMVWAWNAIKTVRKRYSIYSWNYGNDVEALIGQNYSDEVKTIESERYLRECLLINPYITDVIETTITYGEEKSEQFELSCKIQTVYGEIVIETGVG